jgi:hypothetical protein
MSDVRTPVAVRVCRPYASEDELLVHEADTISRSGVVLINAPGKPDGVVLRFELTLSDGRVAMRGEGRVTGTKSVRSGTGLALRFTRLDVKSKQLVDRAVALRDARRAPGTTPSVTDFIALTGEFPIADGPSGQLPSDPPSDRHPFGPPSEGAPSSQSPVDSFVVEPLSVRMPTASLPHLPIEALATGAIQSALTRLRDRAKQLDPNEVELLIATGARARQSRGP